MVVSSLVMLSLRFRPTVAGTRLKTVDCTGGVTWVRANCLSKIRRRAQHQDYEDGRPREARQASRHQDAELLISECTWDVTYVVGGRNHPALERLCESNMRPAGDSFS